MGTVDDYLTQLDEPDFQPDAPPSDDALRALVSARRDQIEA